MTLNDQHTKTKAEIIKLRDLLGKRASQVEKAFGNEGPHLEDLRRLRSQYHAMDLIIKNHFDLGMSDLQNACNSGDRYERFNEEEN